MPIVEISERTWKERTEFESAKRNEGPQVIAAETSFGSSLYKVDIDKHGAASVSLAVLEGVAIPPTEDRAKRQKAINALHFTKVFDLDPDKEYFINTYGSDGRTEHRFYYNSTPWSEETLQLNRGDSHNLYIPLNPTFWGTRELIAGKRRPLPIDSKASSPHRHSNFRNRRHRH